MKRDGDTNAVEAELATFQDREDAVGTARRRRWKRNTCGSTNEAVGGYLLIRSEKPKPLLFISFSAKTQSSSCQASVSSLIASCHSLYVL
jgi:hypothetical protein